MHTKSNLTSQAERLECSERGTLYDDEHDTSQVTTLYKSTRFYLVKWQNQFCLIDESFSLRFILQDWDRLLFSIGK
jgi:hypothetical protein